MPDGIRLLQIGGPALLGLGTVLRILYRRFLRDTTSERSSFFRYLSSGVYFYLGRFFEREAAAAFSTRRYVRAELSGPSKELVVPAKYPVHLRLDEAYVPLVTRLSASTTMAHRDILESKGGRYLIVGDPGSGKSSLAKKLYRSACQEAMNRPSRSRLPIILELRRVSEAAATGTLDLREYLRATIQARSDIYRPDVLYDSAITGRGLVLILDGLDEIPADRTAQVVRAIDALSSSIRTASSDSLIVVTTRVQHFSRLTSAHALEEFQPLELQRFTMTDIYRFLSRWPFNGDRLVRALALLNKIQLSPSLLDLCTNPLILAMYVARDEQTEGESMVDTRTGFYGEIVDEFIVNRRGRHGTRTGRDQLRRERLRILGCAALEHLLSPGEIANSMSHSILMESARKARTSLAGPELEELIDELSVDTGLFSPERSGESHRFMHLTFLEYLAGREIVERGESGWQTSGAAILSFDGAGRIDQRFHECLTFAGGLAPRSLVTRILDFVVSHSIQSLVIRLGVESGFLLDARVVQACGDNIAQLEASQRGTPIPVLLNELRVVLTYLRMMSTSASPDTVALPSASELVASLTRHPRWVQDGLFAQLCRLEPAVSFEAAERAASRHLLQAAASSCDDIAVLAPLVERLSTPNSDIWFEPLVNAALQSHAVSLTLVGARPTTNEVSASDGWRDAPRLGNSLYADLLERLKIIGTAGSPSLAKRVALVRPPRRRDGPTAIIRLYLLSYALLAVVVGVPALVAVLLGSGVLSASIIAAVGLALATLGAVQAVATLVRGDRRPARTVVIMKVGALEFTLDPATPNVGGDSRSLLNVPVMGTVASARSTSRPLWATIALTNRLTYVTMLLQLRRPDARALRIGTAEGLLPGLWRWCTGVTHEEWRLLEEVYAAGRSSPPSGAATLGGG